MTNDEIMEHLTDFFYKVDVEGLDYAIENYFPHELVGCDDVEIKAMMSAADDVSDALSHLHSCIDFVRDKFKIEVS